MRETENNMIYFAAEEDPEILIGRCEERVRQYQRSLRSNVQWRRIIRNLRMVHGLNYPQASDSINFETKMMDSGRLGVHCNLFRTYLANIHTIATGDRIAFRPRAENTDANTLENTQLAVAVLDDLVKVKRHGHALKSAAWHALLMNAGFIRAVWDPGLGQKVTDQEVQQDGKMLPAIYQGGLVVDCPTVADVAWDFGRRSWGENTWCIVRTQVNKFDLAAQFPDKEQEILKTTRDRFNDIWFYYNLVPNIFQDDLAFRYDLYHLPTPSVRDGRHTVYIPGEVLLDESLPYDTLPVFRCAHGEFFGTAMGYSVANDLQSLQEMEANVVSALATNLAANAVGHVWQKPGDTIRSKLFEGGPKILISENEPKAINLTAISPDSWRAVEVFQALMEKISGINATRLGQPEANIRTGKAMAIQIAQAWQAASAFASSYRDMCEDWATHCLKTICRYAKGVHKILVGKANLQYLKEYDRVDWKEYKGEDLSGIDRVIVEAVDPNSNNYVGRVAEATDLMTFGLLKTQEEYIQLKQTGSVEVLYEAPRAKLNLIREENEALERGEEVHANELQDHRTHIPEHAARFGTLRNTRNIQLLQIFLGHIMEHVALWTTPDVNLQMIQLALGNMLPPLPPGVQPLGAAPPIPLPSIGASAAPPPGPGRPSLVGPQLAPQGASNAAA